MFASDLDAASRQQLARGARLMELLKQPQYSPFPVEDQTVSIWAGTTGKLDEVPVEDILRFESELLDYLRRNTKVLDVIRETNELKDDTVAELEKALAKFKRTFATKAGAPLASSASAAPLEEAEVKQEKIVKQKRK
jgi:F-type H+-transporting ATPase subunit alpha